MAPYIPLTPNLIELPSCHSELNFPVIQGGPVQEFLKPWADFNLGAPPN